MWLRRNSPFAFLENTSYLRGGILIKLHQIFPVPTSKAQKPTKPTPFWDTNASIVLLGNICFFTSCFGIWVDVLWFCFQDDTFAIVSWGIFLLMSSTKFQDIASHSDNARVHFHNSFPVIAIIDQGPQPHTLPLWASMQELKRQSFSSKVLVPLALKVRGLHWIKRCELIS